jgi:hypothetical protein
MLKRTFLHVLDEVIRETGHSESYISTLVANDGKRFRRIRAGASFTDRTYDALIDFAAKNGVTALPSEMVAQTAAGVESNDRENRNETP